MAKITINLPGGLKVEREVIDKPVIKPSAPAPVFVPEGEAPLEKAAEVVEEVVKPKRRGRPKKKVDAE